MRRWDSVGDRVWNALHDLCRKGLPGPLFVDNFELVELIMRVRDVYIGDTPDFILFLELAIAGKMKIMGVRVLVRN